ncbi:MAG TPA: DNA translocase FtsK 4TM domain-containing protein [Candidatus Saccharimonadales bacterium]|nr:DNA translocase FtsK 4TM domain-containing protein [Candidatus Saccharimonadales bacterium]
MAAKKKKTTKSKGKSKAPGAVRSPFWSYALAVFLLLIGLFILLGGFNTGGTLPLSLYEMSHGLFGLAAYLLPVLFGFWGIHKFMNSDRRAPAGRLLSLFTAIIIAAGLLHVLFATVDPYAPVGTDTGGKGGSIGAGLGGIALGMLDQIPAAIVLIVAFIPAVFYAFGIPLSLLWDMARKMKPEPREHEDTDLISVRGRGRPNGSAAAAAAAEPAGFRINEGNGPIEAEEIEEPKPRPRFTGLKNSMRPSAEEAPAAAAAVNQSALTTTSDPDWKFPGQELLNQKQSKPDAGDVNGNAAVIHNTFANFNIDVEMLGANIGPRVTQYTLKPPSNVKLTKITALENNLALDLAAHNLRMEAPIPGQQAVGIEVPNKKPGSVLVSSLFRSKAWTDLQDKPLGFVIGKDIGNNPIVADLAKMPHLLVAGQTGSGKSVMINTLLTSLLYHNSPSDMKLILVDPKQVEMAPYNDIPHLLTPVINEPEKCISALKWAVAEMERRLRTMAEVGKRNIGEYNNLKKEEGMPYIVIVIDELADLMMMAARDVEALIVRLAQKARAAGIHLVLATQRPSVDVITGLIKANVPARIAFTVASQVDSRTIIDQMGAEKLLGMGDMLLLTSGMSKPMRVQAAFISDDETAKITEFIKAQRMPSYDNEIVSQPVQIGGKPGVNAGTGMGGGGEADSESDMFRDAVRVVIENKKASTSLLQRRLRIGYGRAARLIEEMEEQGIIGAADGSRPREVLVSSVDQVFGGEGAEDDFVDAEPTPVGRMAP